MLLDHGILHNHQPLTARLYVNATALISLLRCEFWAAFIRLESAVRIATFHDFDAILKDAISWRAQKWKSLLIIHTFSLSLSCIYLMFSFSRLSFSSRFYVWQPSALLVLTSYSIPIFIYYIKSHCIFQFIKQSCQKCSNLKAWRKQMQLKLLIS